MRLLQKARQLGRAEAAIALPDDGHRYVPELVPGEEALDELAERLQIAVEGVELLFLHDLGRIGLLLVVWLLLRLDDARKARADWIDEHQVREGDPALSVVH